MTSPRPPISQGLARWNEVVLGGEVRDEDVQRLEAEKGDPEWQYQVAQAPTPARGSEQWCAQLLQALDVDLARSVDAGEDARRDAIEARQAVAPDGLAERQLRQPHEVARDHVAHIRVSQVPSMLDHV